MTTGTGARVVRPPGRPRDPHAEAAIVEATLELLDDVGYAQLTLEAIAARAGVGKATIYRRWPGKQQLVVHAVATVTESSTAERLPGPLRDDLVLLLERVRRKHETTVAGRLITRLVAEAPELMACYREQVILPRRARLAGRLQRAADAGDLRAGLDLETVMDALIGPVLYTSMVGGGPGGTRAAGRAYVERLVDVVLDGAAAPVAPCG
jgi:AcrR family transcriptional regulator